MVLTVAEQQIRCVTTYLTTERIQVRHSSAETIRAERGGLEKR